MIASVGLDHGVELHREVASLACPVDDELRELPADPLTLMVGADHEAGGGHVRAAARTVGADLGGSDDLVVDLGDEDLPRRRLEPDASASGQAVGVGRQT